MNLCNFPFTSLLEEDKQALDYSMLSDTSTGIFPSPVVFTMTISCYNLYFTRQHSLPGQLSGVADCHDFPAGIKAGDL